MNDGEKLEKLIRRMGAKHPTKFIKGWFITLDEPTSDQRTALGPRADCGVLFRPIPQPAR